MSFRFLSTYIFCMSSRKATVSFKLRNQSLHSSRSHTTRSVTCVSLCATSCWLFLVPRSLAAYCTTWLASPLWLENRSHHYKATYLSGSETGLGLSRVCIARWTWLKNFRCTASGSTTTHRHLTNHVPIIISSLSFFSLLFLSSSQSTISLRLLPPYTPRNETSIFVGSYRSYNVQSPDPGFTPHRAEISTLGIRCSTLSVQGSYQTSLLCCSLVLDGSNWSVLFSLLSITYTLCGIPGSSTSVLHFAHLVDYSVGWYGWTFLVILPATFT